MSITEFVTARLDEDEAVARAAREHEYLSPGRDASPLRWVRDSQGYGTVFVNSGRVLAQCAAMRQIVEEHPSLNTRSAEICQTCTNYAPDFGEDVAAPCPTIRALASIWSDHPDFQQEWLS